MAMKKKRLRLALLIIAGVLGALLLAAVGFGIYYFVILGRTLEQITTPGEETAVFSVYVLAEDSAQRLEDTAGYPYGLSRQEADGDGLTQAEDELAALFGKAPQTTEFENLFDLADALREQTCRAILLNEAYPASLAETPGYEWMETGIRKLESFTVQLPSSPSSQEGVSLPEVDPAADSETFLVYISGIDTYGGIAARSRSDVNILVAVNTDTRKLLMLATPRDFYVDFAASKGQKDKLTHAGIYGVNASMDALERLYSVDIDYYLRINFTGFVQVIDALGGVDVYSEYAFSVKNIREYQKGYNHLTGLEALAFARERYSFPRGDYQRAKNQMEVIRAVVEKCASPALLANYRPVMDAVAGSFETSMPESRILSLVRQQLLDSRPWDISTFTAEGTSAYKPTYSMPGRNLYVIVPGSQSVAQARQQLQAVLSGG